MDTGPVISLVSQDVRSQRGEALIPKGSRFTSEAKRVESAGQTRPAVTFVKLHLPNGYLVEIGDAPGLNKNGDVGLEGKVNNHYLADTRSVRSNRPSRGIRSVGWAYHGWN